MFSTIVAGSQDAMHPARRLMLFILYLLCLIAFLCFIVAQVHTVAHGLFPSDAAVGILIPSSQFDYDLVFVLWSMWLSIWGNHRNIAAQ